MRLLRIVVTAALMLALTAAWSWNDRGHMMVAAVAWGLHPNTELATLMGCEVDTFVRVNDLQQTSQPDIYCAGEATGIGGVEVASIEGEIAGR